MKLKGKVAIVSAAGRGIGRAIALCLAEEGADIVVSSFREETTNSTADAIRAIGRKAVAMPGDITTADTIVRVVKETLDICGKIDIVVNNVGGGRATPTEVGTGPLAKVEALWDGTYEQNLRASVLMCEAVTPHFIAQNSGKIVNVSSIAGRFTPSVKNMERFVPPAYCALKAGLISYTQTLAERLGPHNINVNCVCPGIVYTDAWKGISKRMVENIPDFQGQDSREWFVGIAHGKYPDMFQATPMRREQTAEDLGRAVAFLVSEDAMNITGQTLNVDGGMVKN